MAKAPFEDGNAEFTGTKSEQVVPLLALGFAAILTRHLCEYGYVIQIDVLCVHVMYLTFIDMRYGSLVGDDIFRFVEAYFECGGPYVMI